MGALHMAVCACTCLFALCLLRACSVRACSLRFVCVFALCVPALFVSAPCVPFYVFVVYLCNHFGTFVCFCVRSSCVHGCDASCCVTLCFVICVCLCLRVQVMAG